MDSDLEYIDYTVFLGMNAASEPLRLSCKAFVAERLESEMLMTWDHVGRCDDIIWSYSRRLQDLYYPFMDGLHSQRCVRREGYEESSLRLALSDGRLQRLPVLQRLLAARALEQKAVIYTVDPLLLGAPELPVRRPPACTEERAFPDWLEGLYRQSLELRVPLPPEE
jgi:hypothetical protein